MFCNNKGIQREREGPEVIEDDNHMPRGRSYVPLYYTQIIVGFGRLQDKQLNALYESFSLVCCMRNISYRVEAQT